MNEIEHRVFSRIAVALERIATAQEGRLANQQMANVQLKEMVEGVMPRLIAGMFGGPPDIPPIPGKPS